MSPPGIAPTTEPFGEQITDARETDLGTRNGQLRYLTSELGVTRAQAQRLIRAYELDQRDARHRDAERFVRQEFGGWLQSNYWRCVGRRPVPSMAKPWAVTSS